MSNQNSSTLRCVTAPVADSDNQNNRIDLYSREFFAALEAMKRSLNGHLLEPDYKLLDKAAAALSMMSAAARIKNADGAPKFRMARNEIQETMAARGEVMSLRAIDYRLAAARQVGDETGFYVVTHIPKDRDADDYDGDDALVWHYPFPGEKVIDAWRIEKQRLRSASIGGEELAALEQKIMDDLIDGEIGDEHQYTLRDRRRGLSYSRQKSVEEKMLKSLDKTGLFIDVLTIEAEEGSDRRSAFVKMRGLISAAKQALPEAIRKRCRNV